MSHPPLLIPAVGGENRRQIKATVDAMERLATELGTIDLAVVISPHTRLCRRRGRTHAGHALGRLRCLSQPGVGVEIDNDVEFVERLVDRASGESGLDVEPLDDEVLDHGVLVPLFFLTARRLVNLSVARSYELHAHLGRLVRETVDELGRQAVFVASGDLSHRLQPGAPAGYDPRGAQFDAAVVEHFRRADLDGLRRLDPSLVRGAGECGLRSFIALGACLGADAAPARVLSYEGPFGVGYAVAAFGEPA